MLELTLDETLLREYAAESLDQLSTIESDLLAIEEHGDKFDEERVDRVLKIVHSIKGPAGLFNLTQVDELAKQTENVLARVRSRKLAASSDCISVLLQATDRLSELLEIPATSNQADISKLLSKLISLRDDRKTSLGVSGTPAAEKKHRDGGSLRMLLVEDNFASRLLLQTFLSRYGECHIAVNGKEAVDAFRSALDCGREYDLICMDIMMPEMDGREAVHQVRALEEARGIRPSDGAKIFMTTAVDEIREVFLCFKELCDAYLLKPIDLGQLLKQMKSYQLVP